MCKPCNMSEVQQANSPGHADSKAYAYGPTESQ